MSEINNIVDSLEDKLKKLMGKIHQLEHSNLTLRKELHEKQNDLEVLKGNLTELDQQYKTLKIASSLTGSEDYKRDTKLKINSLIREIDYCIAQLSE